MQDLAVRTVLSRTRVSRIVSVLETAGYVERVADANDGRATLAASTTEGRAALRQAAPTYLAGIQEHFTQHLSAIDAAFYRRITDGLGPELPQGLIVHLAIERPDGGLRYIDVWESEAQCEQFVEERLHPVVHGLLAEIFGDHLPPEPVSSPLTVIHAWGAVSGATRTGD